MDDFIGEVGIGCGSMKSDRSGFDARESGHDTGPGCFNQGDRPQAGAELAMTSRVPIVGRRLVK